MTAVAGQKELVHEYTPRGTALELFHCRDDEVLDSGPGGTGKSRACMEKLHAMALINPRFRGLIARKTGLSLTATTLQTWKEYVAKESLRGGACVYYGGSRDEPAQYRFASGAKIFLTGLDNPVKIMSSEFDVVYVGEATELTPKDWEFITVRLRNGGVSFQQLIADCNPDMPTHWLMQRVNEGKTKILYSQHWENPRYYDSVSEVPPGTPADEVERPADGKMYLMNAAGRSYIKGKLDKLTGVRKQRLRYGRWVAADGLVYENWNPSIHIRPRDVRRPFHVPPEWPRYWVVDFGYRNPFCCQWWAEDPDGQLVMYREIYHTGRLVEDHARQMLRLVTKRIRRRYSDEEEALIKEKPAKAIEKGLLIWTEPEPVKILCDHDAEDRATLERHLGRGTSPANKTVTRGIQAVEARLKPDDRGCPGLVFLADAVVERDPALKDAGLPQCTVEEFPGYVWEPDKDGKPAKETPVKQNDHGVDDVRYIVADRDLRIRIRDRDPWLEG